MNGDRNNKIDIRNRLGISQKRGIKIRTKAALFLTSIESTQKQGTNNCKFQRAP